MSRKITFFVVLVLILVGLVGGVARPDSKALANSGQGAIPTWFPFPTYGIRIDDSRQYVWVNGFDPNVNCLEDPLQLMNDENMLWISLPPPANSDVVVMIKSDGAGIYTELYDATGWQFSGGEEDLHAYGCSFLEGKEPVFTGWLSGTLASNDLTGVSKERWAHSILVGMVTDQSEKNRHLTILNQWVWDPTGTLNQSIRIILK